MHIIKKLEKENYQEYSQAILQSEEKNYQENIRSSDEDIKEILNSKRAIAAVLEVAGHYAGNYLSCAMDDEEQRKAGLENVKINYLYNIVVEKEWQGKGYGRLLLADLIRRCKKRGVQRIAGHYNQQSRRLITQAGGRIIKEVPDWEETGETYYLCVLEL